MLSRLISLVFLVSALFTALSSSAQADDFDFYVLSLSFNRESSSPRIVVHGLWPQNERGWPQYCQSLEPDRVQGDLARQYLDIMPSVGLIGHEWRKHGACSKLSQSAYLSALRRAYESIQLPQIILDGKIARQIATDDLEDEIVRLNKGAGRDAIALSCNGRELDEIRICLDKSLGFRTCREVDRKGCKRRLVLIPPA